MLREASSSLYQEVVEELRIAVALSSSGRRAAGLITVVALCTLLIGTGSVIEEMIKYTCMYQVSNYGRSYGQNGTAAPSTPGKVLTLQEAQLAVAEHRAQHAGLREAMVAEQRVQRVTGYTWAVVMLVTVAIMLMAAVACLAGAHHARQWQWVVVGANFAAVGGTLCCIVALSTWGGFQPIADAGVLAREVFVYTKLNTIWLIRGQALYALAVAITLILTRRTAPH